MPRAADESRRELITQRDHPTPESRRVPAEDRRRVLRFAHLSDAHLQPEHRAPEGLAACLEHAQNLETPPEFVVFGGDNLSDADGATLDEADQQRSLWRSVVENACKVPSFSVLGNHDIPAADPERGKRWALETLGMPARYYAHDTHGWRLLFLDSIDAHDGSYKGRLDPEQFAWLEEQLENTEPTTHVCIISHIPILSAAAYFDGRNEHDGDWHVPGAWVHIDARRIKDLFRSHPSVRLCLAGHNHMVDSVHYLGVTYTSNGAVSGGWWGGNYQEFPPGYATIDLYDDGSSRVRYRAYGWTPKP